MDLSKLEPQAHREARQDREETYSLTKTQLSDLIATIHSQVVGTTVQPQPGPQEQKEAARQDQQEEKARQDQTEVARRSNLSASLVSISDPTGVASEGYRTLRTNLLYSLVDEPPEVIVITSPGPAEGKSTTCANLGVVLTQAGKSTLVVDCDLRKPVQHKLFALRNFHGVTDVLVGERSPQEVWQEPLQDLKIIPVGQIPPNPTELLGSRRFTEFVEQVREQFDYVLIDAPPVELVSDATILATRGDGVLLVLDSQGTRKGSLKRAVRSVEAVGAKVLGTVMNNVKAKAGYYKYDYSSYGVYR